MNGTWYEFIYKSEDDKDIQAWCLGPEDSTREVALRVLKLAASYYCVDPDKIRIIGEASDLAMHTTPSGNKRGRGFLHPMMAIDSQGVERLIEHWYL